VRPRAPGRSSSARRRPTATPNFCRSRSAAWSITPPSTSWTGSRHGRHTGRRTGG
jgi:hypothetical protein